MLQETAPALALGARCCVTAVTAGRCPDWCLCVCGVLLLCCCLLQERVFELGERVLVLSQVGQPALVPHMAEAAGQKLPYEVGGRARQCADS